MAAIEAGFFHREIAETAYRYEMAVNGGRRKIVGLNAFASAAKKPPILKIHGTVEKKQIQRLKALRKSRDNATVARGLRRVEEEARGGANLMPPILECVKAYATLGEIVKALQSVFGEYPAIRG